MPSLFLVAGVVSGFFGQSKLRHESLNVSLKENATGSVLRSHERKSNPDGLDGGQPSAKKADAKPCREREGTDPVEIVWRFTNRLSSDETCQCGDDVCTEGSIGCIAMASVCIKALPPPNGSTYKQTVAQVGGLVVDSDTKDGQKILIQALQQADGRDKLTPFLSMSTQLVTQESPYTCGAASMVTVLNSLEVVPDSKAFLSLCSSPWKWTTETGLENKEATSRPAGRSLLQASDFLGKQGVTVTMNYAEDGKIEDFRKVLEQEVSVDNGSRVIVNYNRQYLQQAGSGHFSPIGAYNESKDMALILDVARFKFNPQWVSVDLLWAAMNDKDGGEHRGYLVVKKK